MERVISNRKEVLLKARNQLNVIYTYFAMGISTFAALLFQSATVFIICIALTMGCFFSEGLLRPNPIRRKR
jgi:hypothetical protein